MEKISNMKTQITQLFVDYIRPSKTIETYMLSKGECFNTVYIYNYEGWYFRVFDSVLKLMLFFDGKNEADFEFDDEEKLDNFLENYPVNGIYKLSDIPDWKK